MEGKRRSPWMVASAIAAAGMFGPVACDNEPPRGAAGESCTARGDCEDGLACVAQVCTQATQSGAASAETPAGECRARRDCPETSVCLDNRCEPSAPGAPGDGRYSTRGESCQAKNDCAAGLSCVMGNCRVVEVGLGRTTKNCYRVECAEKSECCTSFVPPANCEEYKKNCDDEPVFCNTYRSLCECNLDCVGEICVTAEQGCSNNGECTSMQNPFCIEGKCVQCEDDTNCQGEGAKCSNGACVAGCTVDENCPILHACQSGACVEVGCQSDRECVFLTRDALAVCRDTKCQVPCDVDADCAGGSSTNSFQVCDQGQCVFVGCESDAECRALLGLQSMNTRARAVCKDGP
jgi:hypothetical protein